MLYKSEEFVYEFVPLNALLPGFSALFMIVPLIRNVSLLAMPTSPSQAKKPILAKSGLAISKLSNVKLICGFEFATKSNPSKTDI
ncbi:MAG: Uncharacterised protein [Flavobacteriaceae bacterium]|nr:MAG: Uncharacterised protein [Flavobacteriaceae bacterium]